MEEEGLQDAGVELSDEAIIRELCAVSGSNFEKLLETGRDEKIKKIEIFFFGFPRISGLQHFPNLTILCIVNQPIRSLTGLGSCDKLRELWVCETQLDTMCDIERCVELVQLYLYSNQINSIEGLDKLVRLEKLWLNGNHITRVEGLQNLHNLRDLNLAANCVASLGDEINELQKLEILDISGNHLSSFEDLSPLSQLPHLSSLSLSHPHHPPNPLSLLCNYSSLLLFSFPRLHTLDGQDVTSSELKKLVQGLVSKKKMFYRMKVKHAREIMKRKCHTHKQEVRQLKEVTFSRLKTLHSALNMLEGSQSDSGQKGGEKCRLIRDRINDLCSHLDHMDYVTSEVQIALETELDQQISLWEMELGSGGNVKFSPGGPESPWYTSCMELVKSRFSAVSVQDYGFTGIEVKQVLRIENRKLHNRMSSAVQTILDEHRLDSIPPHNDLSLLEEYLFLVWNEETDLLTVSGDGFVAMSTVHLTNSIALADKPRLRYSRGCGQSHGRGQRSNNNDSELLLCKLFKGNYAEIKTAENPSPSDHPSHHSVYRRTNPHISEWFSFHSSLVVPMFLISIQYQSQEQSGMVMDHLMSCDPQTPSDDIILNQAPPLPVRPKLALLDEASILDITESSDLSDVKNLYLHGNHLTRFRLSSCPPSLTHSLLPNLTHLTLSCNDLQTAEDLQNLPLLVELDLSFNKMTSLEGIKNLPKLRVLNTSWNSLACYFSVVAVLRRHTPVLVSLDCRHNPWNHARKMFRQHALSRLKSLQHLNNTPVTSDDTAAAHRYFSTSQLSPSSLSSHVHTVTHPTPSLSLSFTTYTIHRHIIDSPVQFSDSIHRWGSKVTSVHLAGCHIRRLACFDQFPNLQWLCLDNNNINNIEPLSLCPKLQEVSLDHNHLTDLSSLCSLKYLQILSADDNVISALPDGRRLKSLATLHYMSVCHNTVTSMAGLENLTMLHELYTSSNLIRDRCQLFHLKPLGNLAVLSLENNPLANPQEVGVVMGGATYRMFAAYHLHSLKALDGVSLDQSEISSARDKLGGRLTQDVIYERSPNLELSDAHTLDLPNCGIKSVDLSPVATLHNLTSLNLAHNNLASFSGLVHLNQLKVLCLNYNRIESLVSKDVSCTETTVMKQLEVLHLAYNSINNMRSLQLSRIPSLRGLFLQGNEISRVDGLAGLKNLTELVLDRNRIKTFHEASLSDLKTLRVLLVEENRLRSLSHLTPLTNLERLFLGSNKLQDYSELDKLQPLRGLLELSLLDNPLSRRHQHRAITIFNLPALLSLDGVRVTSQERQNAEAIFSITEEQDDMVEMLLPGLPNHPAHIRVMNVPFAPTNSSHTHNHTHHRHPGRCNRGNE